MRNDVKMFLALNVSHKGLNVIIVYSPPEIIILIRSWNEYTQEETPATCTEQVFTCSICGDSYEEVLPATGHDAGEWVVVKETGAFSEGTKELQCTKDGAVLETEMIPQTFPVSLGVVVGICVGVVVIVAGIVIIVVRMKKWN